MTSTFSGVSTALSALIAQRQAIDIAGQNMANANTVGYTRQRAETAEQVAASQPSMAGMPLAAGQGVTLTGITRVGDAFLDAKVYTATGSASFLTARADTYSALETTLGEPADTSLSTQMTSFWSKWQDVSNTPDSSATRSVLLEQGKVVADRLNSLYSDVSDQWNQTRTKVEGLVSDVNTVAGNVADLNARIAQVTNAGGNANELIDQRNVQITKLSDLVGATVHTRTDGSVDVMVGGNVLVSGDKVQQVQLAGAATFKDAAGTSSTPGQGLDLVWSSNPTLQVSLSGGQVAGLLTVLAPTNSTGTGGVLTEAAASLDATATDLANAVNTLHSTGLDLNGAPGGDFFTAVSGVGAASQIAVAITDPTKIAAASATGGAMDGSLADKIGALGTASNSPDATWHSAVVQIGVRSSSATQRATVAQAAQKSAEDLQTASASVDTDEETINLESAQRAYQGAARVMTAVDEMLDTLINHTGTVGRG